MQLPYEFLYCTLNFCACSTVSFTLGFSRSSRVLSLRCKNNIAGVSFVVLCGVFLYCSKKESNLCCSGIGSLDAFSECLKVCTKRSIRPFVVGSNGAKRKYFTPFVFRKYPNSSEVNCGPLLLTRDIVYRQVYRSD